MKKLVAVCVAMVMAFGLMACGGGGVNADAVGTYSLVSMTEDGETMDFAEIAEVYEMLGEETPEFISPTFYSLSADGYYYVNQKDFAAGDTIYLPDSDQTFVVAETRELVGAFNINRGYAVFRQVEILEHTENMLLIRSGTPYGLAVYDHIVQENRGVKEFDVIY